MQHERSKGNSVFCKKSGGISMIKSKKMTLWSELEIYLDNTKPLLLCFSHLRWDFVFQRPQQVLTRAARSYRVIYIEEPVFERIEMAELRLSVREGGAVVAVPVLPEGCPGAEMASLQQVLVAGLMDQIPAAFTVTWYYTPMAFAFGKATRADVVVYDNMDELSAFLGAPPELLASERDLFERADVVFTGGMSLFEAKRDRHHNVHAFPSSVDTAHFETARTIVEDRPDQAKIPHPRIGFFGVVDERMDVDLLRRTAALRPDWQFVIIGPVVKIDPVSLPHAPNIHWLGPKSYSELPQYLAGWDAGFMPFALNEATKFISPTKTPEFLAAGVPVVSTPIVDVVRPYGDRGLVEIAATAEEIVSAIDTMFTRPRAPWLRKVDAFLSTNSWDLTWSAMNARIEDVSKPSRSSKQSRTDVPLPASVF